MKTGVKLCIAISAAVQPPGLFPAVKLGSDPLVIRLEYRAQRVRLSGLRLGRCFPEFP